MSQFPLLSLSSPIGTLFSESPFLPYFPVWSTEFNLHESWWKVIQWSKVAEKQRLKTETFNL